MIGTGVATAGTFTITASKLAAGVHSITAKAADMAGNVGIASATLSITIDTTAPTAPSRPDLIASSDSGVSNTDNITNVKTPTFTGTAETGSTVTLFDGAAVVGTGVANNGQWTIATSALADGSHPITAKATDVAGNIGVASASLAVTIDTTAPTSPIFTSLSTSGITATLSGTGAAGSIVSVFDGTTKLAGSVNVGSGGKWSFIAANATTGTTHIYTAVASDAAGNVSPTFGSAQLGSSGADTLTSTPSNDILRGGSGADTFSFLAAFGKDTISDFTVAGTAHDIINFHGSSILNSFSNVLSRTAQVGSGVVITQDAADTLTLSNVTKANLTSADFRFV
jgi:hypothetical protein